MVKEKIKKILITTTDVGREKLGEGLSALSTNFGTFLDKIDFFLERQKRVPLPKGSRIFDYGPRSRTTFATLKREQKTSEKVNRLLEQLARELLPEEVISTISTPIITDLYGEYNLFLSRNNPILIEGSLYLGTGDYSTFDKISGDLERTVTKYDKYKNEELKQEETSPREKAIWILFYDRLGLRPPAEIILKCMGRFGGGYSLIEKCLDVEQDELEASLKEFFKKNLDLRETYFDLEKRFILMKEDGKYRKNVAEKSIILRIRDSDSGETTRYLRRPVIEKKIKESRLDPNLTLMKEEFSPIDFVAEKLGKRIDEKGNPISEELAIKETLSYYVKENPDKYIIALVGAKTAREARRTALPYKEYVEANTHKKVYITPIQEPKGETVYY